jgi:fructoselysine-6-P-deglycase FrlB-like protein
VLAFDRIKGNDAAMSTWMEQEVASQPEVWRAAADLAGQSADLLPPEGARVAVVGCGTSWFVAQAYAALREAAGHGWTDAFAASELPTGRRYDVLVAISRSGTTSEVVHVLREDVADRTLAVTADESTPVAGGADATVALPFADERSVVQTRFATAALTLLREPLAPGAAAASAAAAELTLAAPLPETAEQWTFVGRGWTVGLANEAALKMRESAQLWTEAYPLYEYRHGPISIAAPGRAIWPLERLEPAVVDELAETGATVIPAGEDPLANLVLVQRTAHAIAVARGLDPDHPRNLTRSVVLPDLELRR